MANTTFTGPVTSLNGFIGGPNVNKGDTQQGGSTAWAYSTSAAVTDGTNTLAAGTNEGVMIYVSDGATGSSIYAFSDGTSWKRVDTNTDISAT